MTSAPRAAKPRRPRLPKGGLAKKPATQKPSVSPAHKAVIDAWFDNGCVSKRRALIAAGYSDKTATGNPHSVFAREDVQKEIGRRRAMINGHRAVTEERIVAELAKLAFANLGDMVEVNEDGSAWLDFTQMSDEHKAALAEMQTETYEEKQFDDDGKPTGTVPVKKTRVKFASKQAALDSLARIKGLFRDKVEISTVQSLTDRVAAARARLHAEKDKP